MTLIHHSTTNWSHRPLIVSDFLVRPYSHLSLLPPFLILESFTLSASLPQSGRDSTTKLEGPPLFRWFFWVKQGGDGHTLSFFLFWLHVWLDSVSESNDKIERLKICKGNGERDSILLSLPSSYHTIEHCRLFSSGKDRVKWENERKWDSRRIFTSSRWKFYLKGFSSLPIDTFGYIANVFRCRVKKGVTTLQFKVELQERVQLSSLLLLLSRSLPLRLQSRSKLWEKPFLIS